MTVVFTRWTVEHSQVVNQVSMVENNKHTQFHSSEDIKLADGPPSSWWVIVDFLDLKNPQTRKTNLLASASIFDIMLSVTLSRFWVCRFIYIFTMLTFIL